MYTWLTGYMGISVTAIGVAVVFHAPNRLCCILNAVAAESGSRFLLIGRQVYR